MQSEDRVDAFLTAIRSSVMPLLRAACQRAIEGAEAKFDLELPRYW